MPRNKLLQKFQVELSSMHQTKNYSITLTQEFLIKKAAQKYINSCSICEVCKPADLKLSYSRAIFKPFPQGIHGCGQWVSILPTDTRCIWYVLEIRLTGTIFITKIHCNVQAKTVCKHHCKLNLLTNEVPRKRIQASRRA